MSFSSRRTRLCLAQPTPETHHRTLNIGSRSQCLVGLSQPSARTLSARSPKSLLLMSPAQRALVQCPSPMSKSLYVYGNHNVSLYFAWQKRCRTPICEPFRAHRHPACGFSQTLSRSATGNWKTSLCSLARPVFSTMSNLSTLHHMYAYPVYLYVI